MLKRLHDPLEGMQVCVRWYAACRLSLRNELVAPLQPEMLPRLTDAELTAAVLDAAIGIP